MSSQGRSQKFVQGGGLIFLHPWGRKPLEMNRFHLIQGGLVPYPPGPWLRLWLSSNSFTPHFHTEPMYTCSNLQCCPNNCTWHATFNSWVRSFYKYFAPIFHFHSEHVLFVYILKQKFCRFYKNMSWICKNRILIEANHLHKPFMGSREVPQINLNPIGSAVLTFIGYERTERQTIHI